MKKIEDTQIATCQVVIGLPGSGKTEYAQGLAAENNATIFSSDDLREEMFGNVNHQTDNAKLFEELYRRIRNHLANGCNAIMDATNINYKQRMSFIQSLSQIPCKKIAVMMATPRLECIARNFKRERKVPVNVIDRMYKNINIPYWYEGWDDIYIVYSDGAENSAGYPSNWLDTVMNYDQDNIHHSLTLGQHCEKTWEIVDAYNDCNSMRECSLRAAAILHDCGKPMCATYVNKKGERDADCHYYGHHFAGAYESLFFDGAQDKLYTAQLIQWHMHPYMGWKQSEKAMNRDKKLLGEELFEDIWKLHMADKAAH